MTMHETLSRDPFSSANCPSPSAQAWTSGCLSMKSRISSSLATPCRPSLGAASRNHPSRRRSSLRIPRGQRRSTRKTDPSASPVSS